MQFRMRYLLAAACAVLAGVLTLVYLGNVGAAAGSDSEVIWVARQEILPGMQLRDDLLQLVEVHSPTRRLLAREALPRTAAEIPAAWFATRAILPGEPLIPAVNVSQEPPGGQTAPPEELRVVSLRAEQPGLPELRPAEEVDLYVVPAEGGEALRILTAARVVQAEADWITVLVPEEQVPLVLAAADGVTVKVVRRLEGILR